MASTSSGPEGSGRYRPDMGEIQGIYRGDIASTSSGPEGSGWWPSSDASRP